MKIELPQFAEKKELFAYLKKHQRDILDIKKGAWKECDVFGVSAFEKNVIKAATKFNTTDSEEVIRRTIVGNTYNWMDKHDDVHIEGIFTRSIQENKSRILHLHDHLQQVGAKVGIPVNVYEERTDWVSLGVDKPGQTVCLCMDSDIKKYLNASVFNQYKNREIDQHSVGMIYVSLWMCFDDPEYKEEYASWSKYIDRIGNKEDVLRQGYFFAVTEAKLKEISAVTEGSNELTPLKYEAADSTSDKSEPQTGAQSWMDAYKQLKSTN